MNSLSPISNMFHSNFTEREFLLNMKCAKQKSQKDGQPSLQGSIKKSTAGMKSQKNPLDQRKRKSELGDCDSNRNSKLPTITKMPSEINEDVKSMHRRPKIKLQLFPLDEIIRTGLEKDGRNPFLELTLTARKKISSVLTHLDNKWGSSSIATGELMLFPFTAVVDNLTSYNRWSSNDIGVTAGDVHSAVGSPEIFRLRYAWISSHPNSSTVPLVCSHLNSLGNSSMEAASGAENQAEINTTEIIPCISNILANESDRLSVLSKPFNVFTDQVAVNNEAVTPSHTNEIENDTADEKNSSAEPVRHEESCADRELSQQQSFLWSDLSNISFGGLLSEVSLQGRFNDSAGNSRFQPIASVPDSMDALINQIKLSHASTNTDMPSSILDAENTCHSFGLSKPSTVKDFLSLGRSAFSGLSSQDTTIPSRFQMSETTVQNEVQKPNAESVPSSAGFYNNENSLGLSGIRWNDSLGPFDLPLIPRQITKDDSLSLGGFVR